MLFDLYRYPMLGEHYYPSIIEKTAVWSIGTRCFGWGRVNRMAQLQPIVGGLQQGQWPMKVLETDRLMLRRFVLEDAAFVLELVNDPSWIQFIGDRRVATLDDARAYIENGPFEMYRRLDFGLWVVTRKEDGERMGMCGLIKRDLLKDVDIGYAFLPKFRGQGYAKESAAAVLAHGHRVLGLQRIVAITAPENHRSSKLLCAIGMRLDQVFRLPGEDEDTLMFAWDAATALDR
jgi:RimJ/RimL family protein N-acetyltransferase